MLKLAYQGELEAFRARVVEERFLWPVILSTEHQRSLDHPEVAFKFIDRICRQNIFIKTVIL